MQVQTPPSQINAKWTTPLLVIAAISMSFLVLVPLDFEITNLYVDFIYVSIPAGLVIYSTRLGLKLWRVGHADAKPIIWFAIGSVALFVGEMWWTVDEDILGVEPFPSAADFFYLSSYPFFSAFFWHYLKSHRKFISNKVILFGFAISASLLMPSIITTYDLNAEESNFGIAVALAYPIVDVAILGFAVISMMSLFQEGKNYFWIMMAFGIFAWISGNIIFLYAEINETYYDGHPADIMWLSAYVIRLFAVIDYGKKIRTNPDYVLGHTNSRKIKFGAIHQLAIPMSVGTVILLSLLILASLGGFDFTNNPGHFNGIVFLSLATITIFSIMIMILNKNLSNLVKIREKELDEKNQQLLRSERLSAIGEISARIAHDIRNPLSIIKNSVEIILYKHKDHLTESDTDMVSKINKATARISHQVDDVLDFVKEKNLRIGNHSTRTLLQTVVSEIQHSDKLIIEVEPTNVFINCDVELMHRVFVNLIINSMQAMEEQGKITIKVREENKNIIFEIEDSGPGVPASIRDRIFDPLVTTKQSGTGLGLSICKRIIEQHGGAISYKSNPTRFIVALPKQIHL